MLRATKKRCKALILKVYTRRVESFGENQVLAIMTVNLKFFESMEFLSHHCINTIKRSYLPNVDRATGHCSIVVLVGNKAQAQPRVQPLSTRNHVMLVFALMQLSQL